MTRRALTGSALIAAGIALAFVSDRFTPDPLNLITAVGVVVLIVVGVCLVDGGAP